MKQLFSSLSKDNKFFITFIVLACITLGFFYFYNRDKTNNVEEYYQIISQPTVTNPNPIVTGYNNDNGSNYMMPYKTPMFAPVSGVNLSSNTNMIPSQTSNNEMFHYQIKASQSQPEIATFPSGNYIIKNKKDGILLNSIAFTPVQCNNFLINYKPVPNSSEGWKLHEVSKGIYIFKKPSGKECLYASIGDTLKSYQLEPSCTKNANVCGLESLDYEKKLDPNSSRTYFEVWKYPEGYAIRNVDNKKFICIKEGKVTFSDIISQECLFNINSV